MMCAKGLPMPSPVSKAALQPRLEFVMGLLRLPAFGLNHDGVYFTALLGLRLVMPLQRVASREKVSTVVAKRDPNWVGLHLPAVPLKTPPNFEACARAETAFEHADRPACPVARCRFEESSVPLAESSRDVEESALRLPRLAVLHVIDYLCLLRHRAVDLVPRSGLHTPFNPWQLFLHNDTHRSVAGVTGGPPLGSERPFGAPATLSDCPARLRFMFLFSPGT
ncbi:hypothetical protein BC827DRAFT_135115 [Russula dissimulans]|nr:hypothetical protein BC827DRAFT_135115 [Russula dissimulans]